MIYNDKPNKATPPPTIQKGFLRPTNKLGSSLIGPGNSSGSLYKHSFYVILYYVILYYFDLFQLLSGGSSGRTNPCEVTPPTPNSRLGGASSSSARSRSSIYSQSPKNSLAAPVSASASALVDELSAQLAGVALDRISTRGPRASSGGGAPDTDDRKARVEVTSACREGEVGGEVGSGKQTWAAGGGGYRSQSLVSSSQRTDGATAVLDRYHSTGGAAEAKEVARKLF